MVCHESPESCAVLLHLFVCIHMQINDNIRDFPIWKFAVHNVTGAGVLFEQLISFRERKEIWKNCLSATLLFHEFL